MEKDDYLPIVNVTQRHVSFIFLIFFVLLFTYNFVYQSWVSVVTSMHKILLNRDTEIGDR